jgi:hypothetical protein
MLRLPIRGLKNYDKSKGVMLIHKSNVAMVIGVVANRGRTYKFKYLSTMVGRISFTNVL